ncbi:MAG: LytTR family DNA-binding domain-containing protein [Lentimicrobium sp.]|mgnify:CR=1 FL=1|jgi:two-component system LytT family response regulator|nr:LytTR family DNA-binding domain-containing protein [Lentimicrobium sp.]MDD2526550.1 LytTR family DNA-binding domain-containing protein [Lentimicrobiaceae bacterium]MDD4597311.1 LytTR family DNA-binding domain-containing protein [Lentimicrobiaceae bacterium]MDY0024616.1 LytTR family DNA-binding domain-containing protein [Lentimicrobium sp.]
MDKVKILIVDDEPPARELLKQYLVHYPGLEIIGECENGFEALKMIQEFSPQLVFLDIQMPKINGFELLELLTDPPKIIFTTAFDEFAIRAFELNAVDYLLKPFSAVRFNQAVDKALNSLPESWSAAVERNSLMSGLESVSSILERTVVRVGSRILVIAVHTIYYIEAQDDYVMIHSEQGRHLKEKTMKYFEHHLPADEFIRIHRSYIVNINYIVKVEPYTRDTHVVVLKNEEKLRVSAGGYKKLMSLL